VTAPQYRFEPLGRHHDRAAFSCGAPELDRYLQRQARQDMQRHIAAVFVLQDGEEAKIAGYYTLSATAIRLIDLPEGLSRRLPRYPDLPAVLLGRLAVDAAYQGQGLGEILLMDALTRALTQSQEIAALAVIVDAKDEAAVGFYRRYGFQQLEDQPRRLFLPMQTIAALLASPE
jgi:ribosomal protein S18 acetylase RimI-like enzyme